MKFTIQQSTLSTNLNLVGHAVSSQPSHPVLANILLEADEATQQIKLSAFDLSLGIQTSFPANIETGGKLTLPAKLLTDIISRLADGALTLDSNSHGVSKKKRTKDEATWEEPVDVTSNPSISMQIIAASGKYEVRGRSAEEFPDLPEVDGETIALSPESLRQGLHYTLFAASSDKSKAVLTGVHLAGMDDGLEMCSTNGHVLSVFSAIDDSASKLDLTVPAKALQELLKLLGGYEGAIDCSYDHSQIVFEWEHTRLTSRLLEGQYPNYRQLIPTQFSRQVTVERRLLLSALERIAVLADQKNNIVKIALDGPGQLLTLSVEAQDVGSGRETLSAQITGDDLELAFNVKYLVDGLKAIRTTEVMIQLNTATSPAIVSPLGQAKMTYLVMPVQRKS